MHRGPHHQTRARSAVAALLALVVLASACSSSGDDNVSGPDGGGGGGGDPEAALRVTTVSGPAEYVTGGDAVIAIESPAGDPLDDVTVTVDGVDVTDRFAPDESPHRAPGAAPRLLGLVDELPEGTSEVVARSGDAEAELTLVDHPVSGPLFSGPHQSPLVCTTERAGLGPPGDECSAPAEVSWRYVDTAGEFQDLADPTAVPADVGTAVTTIGTSVPFVVRVERTVLNRAIVETAILDPAPGTAAADGSTTATTPAASSSTGAASEVPTWDPSGWNGRLVMRFGGGCGVTYSQGSVLPTALQADLLGAGYGVVASSLTSFQTACNATVSAETALVAKEHFTETYGVPRHTIGSGGSGGAIQQLQIAQNYPGILDALAPSAVFPDAVSIAPGVADCGLLERWFGRDGGSAGIIPDGQPSGAELTQDQQMAITGFASPATCRFWTQSYLETLDASSGCAPELATQVYDVAVRPRGVRCTFQDGNVNLLGLDLSTGFAQRPLDNVGVQYGLEAVRAGDITVDEFLALNEGIGGFDIDGAWQPERMRASEDGLERAYATGLVTAGTATAEEGALGVDGSGGLADVPIIAVNVYTDRFGDIHDRQRAFALRERLRTPDGEADPLLSIWTVPLGTDLAAITRQFEGGPEDAGQPVVQVLDRWLTRAEEATQGSWAERLAAAKTDDEADRCELPSGEVVTGPDVYDDGSPCTEEYPIHSDPRQVAGAPLVNDVLACELVPIDVESYGVGLSDEQVERLRTVFPEGVCDWDATGRGQQELDGTWQVHDLP